MQTTFARSTVTNRVHSIGTGGPDGLGAELAATISRRADRSHEAARPAKQTTAMMASVGGGPTIDAKNTKNHWKI
jgi:hypothetical protein